MTPDQIVCLDSNAISPPAGHYSHVCVAGSFVHVSGQLPIAADGTPLRGSSFVVQTKRVLANLDACLKEAQTSRERLVQVRVFVTDINNWSAFNEIYKGWIGAHKPARAVAGVSELHYGLAVEVEAIALV
ncbi:RidA family protein [Mesorhizobium sp.]|uniref:RidA family protein n=1 Tax=Mesorhizobium sp. TaxID=1871066 RepID=UPI000FE6F732|nr:RidA family protein [Mesorhizobium sp.]RWB67671.1 MAG: RidA family protein [Mesorhizobium sp.]RWB84067.1 MAG: RidA family protein [Mesorhizobium sp.]